MTLIYILTDLTVLTLYRVRDSEGYSPSRLRGRNLMKIFVGIVMTLFICMTFRGYTQQTVAPQREIKYVVAVDIQCDDENTKQWIKSYINRELRSLGDVVVSGEKTPDILIYDIKYYNLGLIVIELTMQNIKTGQIAISAVHLEFIQTILDPMFAGTISPEMHESIRFHLAERGASNKNIFLDMYRFRCADLQISKKDKLSELCKRIVTNFDIKTLQVAREGK